MFNVINPETSDYNFFPAGSFDSRKDSAEMSELLEFKEKRKSFSLSASEELFGSNYSQFIAYEELSPILKNFISKEDGWASIEMSHKNQQKIIENIKQILPPPKDSLSERSKEKFSETGYLKRIENLSRELIKSEKENVMLKEQIGHYKELVDDYEESIRVINAILEGIRTLNFGNIKFMPRVDTLSSKSIKKSLESISLFISVLANKSVKALPTKEEPKKMKCLKLDDVYPSILIPESPEPPKAKIIKRQSSNMNKLDKHNQYDKDSLADKRKLIKMNLHEGSYAMQPKTFKSVSPILKSKHKQQFNKK